MFIVGTSWFSLGHFLELRGHCYSHVGRTWNINQPFHVCLRGSADDEGQSIDKAASERPSQYRWPQKEEPVSRRELLEQRLESIPL